MRFKDALNSKLVLLIFLSLSLFPSCSLTTTAQYQYDTLSVCIYYLLFNIAICMTSNQYTNKTLPLILHTIQTKQKKIKSNHDMIYDFLFEECVKCCDFLFWILKNVDHLI